MTTFKLGSDTYIYIKIHKKRGDYMLDSYIYKNLREFGNCALSERVITTYGEDKILEELKKQRFKLFN